MQMYSKNKNNKQTVVLVVEPVKKIILLFFGGVGGGSFFFMAFCFSCLIGTSVCDNLYVVDFDQQRFFFKVCVMSVWLSASQTWKCAICSSLARVCGTGFLLSLGV